VELVFLFFKISNSLQAAVVEPSSCCNALTEDVMNDWKEKKIGISMFCTTKDKEF